MTQAQQPEALRLAAICETKGMFPVADELNRMHARILELEQGKCLHQIAEPAAIHLDDEAVDNLAYRMKAKLEKQREKGYGGWDTDCTQERLSELLRQHVDKGDPVDVANFCAFLQARGEGISAAPQAVQPAVPETREALAKRLIADVQVADTIATAACQRVAELPDRDSPADWPEAMLVTGDELHMIVREAVIEDQATPAHPAEGVPAMAAPFAEVLTDEDMEDFVSTHGFTGDFESMARIVEEKVLEKVAATQPAAQGMEADLTDEQIDEAFNQMPDGAAGFLKSWGYRQFARAVLAAQAKQGGAA